MLTSAEQTPSIGAKKRKKQKELHSVNSDRGAAPRQLLRSLCTLWQSIDSTALWSQQIDTSTSGVIDGHQTSTAVESSYLMRENTQFTFLNAALKGSN